MVHIVEIEDFRGAAGKDSSSKKRIITYALEYSIYVQCVFGFLNLLVGLAGLPASLVVAAKILGLGCGQLFSAIPGMQAIQDNCNRFWIVFIVVQIFMAICQLSWFIVCLCESPIHGWLAALYFLLFVFQLWLAIAGFLHTGITSYQEFVQELRGKDDKGRGNGKPARKTKSMSSTSCSSTVIKKNDSTTSSIKGGKTPKTAASSPTKSKTDSKKKSQSSKDGEKKKEAATAAGKSERTAEEKATKPSSSQQKQPTQPDKTAPTSKIEKSSVARSKEKLPTIPEAKTPPALSISSRRKRYYFVEHAVDLESEISDESPTKPTTTAAAATSKTVNNKKAPASDTPVTTTTKAAITTPKTISSKPKPSSKESNLKVSTPPGATDQPNSLLSSQATQNSSKSMTSASKKTADNKSDSVLQSPQPSPSAVPPPPAATTTTTTSSVTKTIQGAFADPMNIINHQLLNKTL